jgi:hypothetical protein
MGKYSARWRRNLGSIDEKEVDGDTVVCPLQ